MFLESVSNILLFLGAIAAMIFIHELGHYLGAVLQGIEVEEFGFGFPPRAAKLFTYRGTDFTLNWIPLGGFVRPKGENDPDVPGGLASAPPLKRIIVLLAGPAMNLLAAGIIFAILFSQIGYKVQIVEVHPESPAATAGLQPGDVVVALNGTEIDVPLQMQDIIYSNLEQSISFEYSRGGEVYTTNLVPRSNPPEGQAAIGIAMNNAGHPIEPLKAVKLGFIEVYNYSYTLLSIPGRIIQGQLAPEAGRLVGYKGMYDIFATFREMDQELPPAAPAGINTLNFIASISVSLGLLNLLPIPALDGGRILFALPELIIRRRIPQDFENVVNLISFAVLILLLFYVNILDFINPVIP